MDKIRPDPSAAALEVIGDKELPWFVRHAATAAMTETPLFAANGFRLLAKVFSERAEAIHGVPVPFSDRGTVEITPAGEAELHRLKIAAGEIPPDSPSTNGLHPAA